MYDGSALPYEENVANTKKAVAMAREYGAPLILGAAVDYVHRMVSVQATARRTTPCHGRPWRKTGRHRAGSRFRRVVRRETGFIRVFRVNGAFQAAVPERIESSGFRMVLPQKHIVICIV